MSLVPLTVTSVGEYVGDVTVESLRISRADQRDATRSRILDAAVACLIELGYAQTTTLMVQERAGVSRGSLLHHFPSRADLLADAIAHLFSMQMEQLGTLRVRSGNRVEQGVRLMWALSSSSMVIAAIELWTAARTDLELRQALVRHDAEVTALTYRTCAEIFGPELAAHPHFASTMWLLITSMRGNAQNRSLHPTASASADISTWVEVVNRMLS